MKLAGWMDITWTSDREHLNLWTENSWTFSRPHPGFRTLKPSLSCEERVAW
jgi:hypothetical protein